MSLFQNRYRIESARCAVWDYSSPGYYFVTICTYDRLHLFGNIKTDTMQLNEYGKITLACWNDLPNHYRFMRPDAFIVMPNHIHAVIRLIDDGGIGDGGIGDGGIADDGIVETGLKPVSTTNHETTNHETTTTDTNNQSKPLRRHGLSEIVRAFKTFSARRINELRVTPGRKVWQPRFHDRIIRDEQELFRIRRYILNNPQNWHKDDFYPPAI